MTGHGNLTQRIYRFLLRSCPKNFREEYGEEMDQVFGDLLNEERHRGKTGFVKLWIRTLTDLAMTAVRERGETLMPSRAIGWCSLSAMFGGALTVMFGIAQAYSTGRTAHHFGALFEGLLEFSRGLSCLLLVGGLVGIVLLVEKQGRTRYDGTKAASPSPELQLSLTQVAAIAGITLAGVAVVASVTALMFSDRFFGLFSLGWCSLLLATLLLGFVARRSRALRRWRSTPLAVGALMLTAPSLCFSLALLIQEFYPDNVGMPYALIFIPVGLPYVLMGFAWILLGCTLLVNRSSNRVADPHAPVVGI